MQEVTNTEAFEAHLPLHCPSPSADADDEFGNGVLQAGRILSPESPKTCDCFTKIFLHTRTVIFLHSRTMIFLLIRTVIFFFLLNAVNFFCSR